MTASTRTARTPAPPKTPRRRGAPAAPPRHRRAVRERDKGRCQFPGRRSWRTDLHHIIAWAKGGKTRLRDLILLCEAHHVIVQPSAT